MKYRILFDYGSYEGLKFAEGDYETVDDAVRAAVGLNYSTPFIIVTINWTPQGKEY